MYGYGGPIGFVLVWPSKVVRLQRGGGYGQWVGVFGCKGYVVLEPFVAVKYVVLKCCQAVISWLKTFMPSSSLTDPATCAILPITPVEKPVALCSRRLPQSPRVLVCRQTCLTPAGDGQPV